MLYGSIEAGGTKFVCAVGSGPDQIIAETRFPTTSPKETIGKTVQFFKEQHGRFGPLEAIGIAAFGPLDLNPISSTYGYITATPKTGWAYTDLVGEIQRGLGGENLIPVGIDTDVNGAALAEWRWGAGQGVECLIYLTIGTGIGGGVLINGQLLHGLVHPEMGHINLPHDLEKDPFPGSCPFHKDCFEGLAAGPALEKRWGQRAETLPLDHPAWELEAHYLALALMDYILVLSPQRIILGGGVMAQTQIFPILHRKVQEALNNYVNSPDILVNPERYIVPPGLGGKAGISGGIALAQRAVEK